MKSSDERSGPYLDRSGSKLGGAYALSSMRRDEFSTGEQRSAHGKSNYSEQIDTERTASMDNGGGESILREALRYGIKETMKVEVTFGNKESSRCGGDEGLRRRVGSWDIARSEGAGSG